MTRVNETNGQHETAHDDSQRMHQHFLCPQRLGCPVNQITDHAAHWPKNCVEEAVHGCPSTRPCLSKVGKILEIVSPQKRVDGELSAKGAEIGRDKSESRKGHDCPYSSVVGRLFDKLPARSVEEIVFVRSVLFLFCAWEVVHLQIVIRLVGTLAAWLASFGLVIEIAHIHIWCYITLVSHSSLHGSKMISGIAQSMDFVPRKDT